jgi:hypothetical protein
MRLVEIAERLHNDGIFTGGPPHLFESGGRLQLSTLVREGIWPSSKMLDIGCGCLRAGYWIVHLLNPGCYFGIEPNEKMLQAGIERVIGPELRAAKRPRFDTNDRFDFSVFGEKFDVFLARSIWTHASKLQIQTMLDGFVLNSNPAAFFLASYHPASWFGRRMADYKGTRWVGKSHTSDIPGLIRHKRSWIESECRARGLSCQQLSDRPFNQQCWLKIKSKSGRAVKESAD